MNSSERKRLDSVLRNGVRFMELTSTGKPGIKAIGFANSESRGYKTEFDVKHFFYLLTKDDKGFFGIKGITKDSRRKTFKSHCRENNIDCQIINQKWFEIWLS
jgi:hypothetical protein